MLGYFRNAKPADVWGPHVGVTLPLAIVGSILLSPSCVGYKTAPVGSAGPKSCACPNGVVAQVSTLLNYPSPEPTSCLTLCFSVRKTSWLKLVAADAVAKLPNTTTSFPSLGERRATAFVFPLSATTVSRHFSHPQVTTAVYEASPVRHFAI
jgi:hypothetical protein